MEPKISDEDLVQFARLSMRHLDDLDLLISCSTDSGEVRVLEFENNFTFSSPISRRFAYWLNNEVTQMAGFVEVSNTYIHPLCHIYERDGSEQVGAYLGIPILNDSGKGEGAAGVFAPKPRVWQTDEIRSISKLADVISNFL